MDEPGDSRSGMITMMTTKMFELFNHYSPKRRLRWKRPLDLWVVAIQQRSPPPDSHGGLWRFDESRLIVTWSLICRSPALSASLELLASTLSQSLAQTHRSKMIRQCLSTFFEVHFVKTNDILQQDVSDFDPWKWISFTSVKKPEDK